MKKILIVLFTILLCSQFVNAAELPGYKTQVSPNGTYKLQIPEKAPDFLTAAWKQEILARGRFPDGTLWTILVDEKDGMMVQSFVIGRPDVTNPPGRYIPLMVGFFVSYDGKEFTDYYFDERFLETGEPSGVFSGPITLVPAKEKLERFVLRFRPKI